MKPARRPSVVGAVAEADTAVVEVAAVAVVAAVGAIVRAVAAGVAEAAAAATAAAVAGRPAGTFSSNLPAPAGRCFTPTSRRIAVTGEASFADPGMQCSRLGLTP